MESRCTIVFKTFNKHLRGLKNNVQRIVATVYIFEYAFFICQYRIIARCNYSFIVYIRS